MYFPFSLLYDLKGKCTKQFYIYFSGHTVFKHIITKNKNIKEIKERVQNAQNAIVIQYVIETKLILFKLLFILA